MYPEQWRSAALAHEADADPARGGPEQATRFERAVGDGYQAARRLRELMAQPGGHAPPLASYLAVVVHDLDSMGLFLSGRADAASGQKIGIDPNEHGRVSRDLLLVAQRQSDVLKTEQLLAVPVYAGVTTCWPSPRPRLRSTRRRRATPRSPRRYRRPARRYCSSTTTRASSRPCARRGACWSRPRNRSAASTR